MRVIQQRKSELTLYDGIRVRMVPNTPYFFLKYVHFEGNKISYVLSEKPYMRIYETGKKEFTCNYNDMSINVMVQSDVEELCSIITQHQKNKDFTQFENFFAQHFTEQNQKEILDIFLKPYSQRITQDPAFDYIIDGIFGVKNDEIYVTNPLRKKFPWDKISINLKGDFPENKTISSFDGNEFMINESLQKLVTKIFYLLNTEKKHDAIFMVQLPRKVQRWIDVGDAAVAIKWNVPTEIKEEITVPNFYNYYPTPAAVVEILLYHAEIKDGDKVLEPSAGQGHILDHLKNCNITCGELYSGNQEILKKKGYTIAFDNFLEFESPNTFDKITMNPPFDEQKDIDHVNHAYAMLKPGGRLVSVMANGITFRDNGKTNKLKKLIEKNGYIIKLPKESFKKSGTLINTVIVVIDKND